MKTLEIWFRQNEASKSWIDRAKRVEAVEALQLRYVISIYGVKQRMLKHGSRECYVNSRGGVQIIVGRFDGRKIKLSSWWRFRVDI